MAGRHSRRADEALLNAKRVDTLSLARALIMEGRVYENERRIDKPSDFIADPGALIVREKERAFVSRGGYKLQKALEVFGIDLAGQVCVDVGSSTGGFTDVMLRGGARRVYAVDVGYGLLDWSLRSDPRVTVMERTNARFLTSGMFDECPSFGATDVSFISLKAILPAAFAAMGNAGRFVALVKPQFEAPKEQVGPKGIVRDTEVHRDVLRQIVRCVKALGWRARDIDFSPIRGAEGNIEFLLDLLPGADPDEFALDCKINVKVDEACDNFMKSLR